MPVFQKNKLEMHRNKVWTLQENQFCTENENMTKLALSNKNLDETESKQPQAYSPEEQRMNLIR